MNCSTSGFPVLHYFSEFPKTHVHWVSDAIQPSHPLLLPSPFIFIFPSIRVFSSESALCIRWPRHRSFSFSINSFNEYSGLISFRMEWFVLLDVPGTLKSLLQHYNSKVSILQRSWQPAPVFLSGEFRGQRSLAGYSPWGCNELDMTEQLTYNLLYGPALTSVHDDWKNHSFGCREFCKQRDVSAF